jgi:hypothetical protein
VADHVTAVFEVLLTVAVNCCVPPEETVGDGGFTLTVIVPEVLTTIWYCCDAESVVESVTDIVKSKVPACEGVPEIFPVLWLRVNPVASWPDVIEK